MKRPSPILAAGIIIIVLFTLILLLVQIQKKQKETVVKSVDDRFEEVTIRTSSDTLVETLVDQIAKVHSRVDVMNLTYDRSNNTLIEFTIPDCTKVWSYYIEVSQPERGSAYADAANDLLASSVPMLFHDPLAALAMGYSSYLVLLQSGENVRYCFSDNRNIGEITDAQSSSCFKSGDVINDFGRMTEPLSGKCYLLLKNDNNLFSIDVEVKIIAIVVTNQYKTTLRRKRGSGISWDP